MIGCLIVTIIIVGFGFCYSAESNYTREGTIQKVGYNVVTVEDSCGYLWNYEYEGDAGVTIGDSVLLEMNDRQTSEYIFDDVVLNVKILTK